MFDRLVLSDVLGQVRWTCSSQLEFDSVLTCDFQEKVLYFKLSSGKDEVFVNSFRFIPILYCRTVELQSGKVEIDGYNIREIGLDVLRGRLALVPQDSSLFLGTLRENL